jgi:hypothetical protein
MMRQTHIKKWTLKCLGLITLLLLAGCVPAIGAQDTPPTPAADQLLPLPSTMTLEDYEPLLFDFLESKQYQELDWAYDKRVRDTGPYIDGVSYGTHPAVRIYYSPEVYDWLKNGRVGDLPDGAMIIKEMFPTPAARYTDFSADEINDQLSMWTYMVRDRNGSKDGWFWGYHGTGDGVDSSDYPFNLRCGRQPGGQRL